MENIKYTDFIKIIPKETAKYFDLLVGYFATNSEIDTMYNTVKHERDLLFYKSLKAYQKSNNENKKYLSKVGFLDNSDLIGYSLSTETKNNIFTKYYRDFMPFENEEDYLLLTPEDIIKNIYNNNKYYCDKTLELFNVGEDTILKRLTEKSKEKSKILSEELINDLYKNASISVINYFNTAARIYEYLDNNKKDIKNIEPTDNNLKSLAFTLALFYYDHVSSYGDTFNEKQIIIEHLDSLGLDNKKLEEKIGLKINLNVLSSKPSIKVLKKKLNADMIKLMDLKNTSVGEIFDKLINNNDTNISYRIVFGLCNTTIFNVSKYSEKVKSIKKELDTTSVESMYDPSLMPSISNILHRTTLIYTYLNNNKDKLNEIFITSDKDLLVLSLLLTAYERNSYITEFFNDKGLSFDKILELLNLPNKEKFYEAINNTKEEEKNVVKFKKLIFGGYSKDKNKSDITEELLYSNLTTKAYSESNLIHKLFSTVNNEKLPDNYNSFIKDYLKNKEQQESDILKEEIFKNVSIDVYNYLEVVSSYYDIFKKLRLSHEDAEQLSIIYAASRYDSRLNDYMEHIGLSRRKMSDFFGLDFSYEKKKMNVKAIDGELRKYIFDRDDDKITVYSIFQNAFEPKLTNSVKLRQLLYKVGKEPEDFLNIGNSIDEYEKEKLEKEKNNSIIELNSRVTKETKNYMNDVLRIYKYLKDNVKDNSYINNNYVHMSLLIAGLIHNEEYKKYFIENGITLEYVLSLLNISNINEILNTKLDETLIIDFKKYFGQASRVDSSTLITDIIYSDMLKRIILSLDLNYSETLNSISNKKEKDITPREGIELLSEEEVTKIDNPGVTVLANYGSSISKHSKYINDALHELMFSDTIDSSIKDINNALGEVVTEERIEPPKLGFFESLFAVEEKPKIIKKYDPSKLSILSESIDEQLMNLNKELEGYEYIKRYIELYLVKLEEHLNELKRTYASLEEKDIKNTDDIGDFTRLLNERTTREILKSKISTFETMMVLMKQELVSVHRAIINHFITINSLQTSKHTILPLLASEMTINIGNKTESEALDLTNNLIGLLQSIVNKNVELTEQNLLKLKGTSISNEAFDSLNREINLYLDSINRSSLLLEDKDEEHKNDEDNPQILKM